MIRLLVHKDMSIMEDNVNRHIAEGYKLVSFQVIPDNSVNVFPHIGAMYYVVMECGDGKWHVAPLKEDLGYHE